MMQATAGASAATPVHAAAAAPDTAGANGGTALTGAEAAAPDGFAALLESASAAAPAQPQRMVDTSALEAEAPDAVEPSKQDSAASVPGDAALSLLAAPLLMLQDRACLRAATPSPPRPAAAAPATSAAQDVLSAAALRCANAHGVASHARDGAALLPAAGAAKAADNAAPATAAREPARSAHLPPAPPQLEALAPAAAVHGTQAAAFGLALAAADPALQRHSTAPGPAQDGAAPAAALLAAPAAPVADAPPVHQAALPSQPFDAAFAGELAAEVRLMAACGLQRAELHLNPSDLGPIHIQLSVNSQTADISFAVSHAATRDGIAQALPALRDMLAGQGLSLGQAGVSSQHPGQPSGDGRQFLAHPPQGAAPVAGARTAPTHGAPISLAIRRGRGMLDLYA